MANRVLDFVDQDLERAVRRLLGLIKIPSISAYSQYHGQLGLAAQYLAKTLTDIGFEVEVSTSYGAPIVIASTKHGEAKPNLLFYGHYDVYPADSPEEWDYAPFEPNVLNMGGGKLAITGRGSSDNKGQLMMFIEACRAYNEVAGEMPCNVTVLLEGAQEIGSPGLSQIVKDRQSELNADIAFICDTQMFDHETPAITKSLRGLICQEVVVANKQNDLQSLTQVTSQANPLKVLCLIISSMFDKNGNPNIPGFQNSEPRISSRSNSTEFIQGDKGHKILSDSVTVSAMNGSSGNRLHYPASIEINGITGGDIGTGFRTTLPETASAKISIRLTTGQNPEKILRNFHRFVAEQLPSEFTVEFLDHGSSSAFELDITLDCVQLTAQAIENEWKTTVRFINSGGSICAVSDFDEILGVPSILVGFANADDRWHGLNEKFELRSFHKGIRSWVRILSAFGKTTSSSFAQRGR